MRIKTANNRKKSKTRRAVYCNGSCRNIIFETRCYPSTLWKDRDKKMRGRCNVCGKKLRKVFIKIQGHKKFIGYV